MKLFKFLVVVWLMREFMTSAGMVDFINTLTDKQQKEAKITCWNYACVVVYPK